VKYIPLKVRYFTGNLKPNSYKAKTFPILPQKKVCNCLRSIYCGVEATHVKGRMNPSMGLESRIHATLTLFPWVASTPLESIEDDFCFQLNRNKGFSVPGQERGKGAFPPIFAGHGDAPLLLNVLEKVFYTRP